VDPDLAELASAAGLTVVKLMTTELWQQARTAVARLFARHSADQPSADQPARAMSWCGRPRPVTS
jgi:hypothetical protein